MGFADEAANPNGRQHAIKERLRQGDAEAFHWLVDRYGTHLYRVALGLVGQAADAEDVVQATLLGAFRSIRSFRGEASVKTWLTKILLRQAGRHRRERVRRRAVSLDSDQPGDRRTRRDAPSDVRMDVAAAVGALPSAFRQVVVLREFSGLGYDQIAQLLGLPRGTVESRLFRARRRLRELLRGYIDHEGM